MRNISGDKMIEYNILFVLLLLVLCSRRSVVLFITDEVAIFQNKLMERIFKYIFI